MTPFEHVKSYCPGWAYKLALLSFLALLLAVPKPAQANMLTTISAVCHNLLSPLVKPKHFQHPVTEPAQPKLGLTEIQEAFAIKIEKNEPAWKFKPLAKSFVEAYWFEASQIENFEDATQFFSTVEEILSVKEVDEIFDVSHGRPSPRSTLWKIFNFNHTQLFLNLKTKMATSEILRLRETIYSIRSEADHTHTESGTRRLWWKVIWLYDLIFFPEAGLENLLEALEERAFHFDQNGKKIFNMDTKGILLHSPDVIEVFSRIPDETKREIRKKLIDLHYMQKKHKDALAILQSLNHNELRQLAEDLSLLETRQELNSTKVTDAVNKYWDSVGYLLGFSHEGYSSRGGYDFSTVLKGVKGFEKVVRESLGENQSLLMIGSYVNGLAHLENGGQGKMRFKSDLDITFSHPKPFLDNLLVNGPVPGRGLTGYQITHWLNGNRKSPLFKALEKLESLFIKNLKIESAPKGSVISPLAQISYDTILNTKEFNSHTYVMLASPIALEVSSNHMTIHIHYLPENALEPITKSFKFGLENP